MFPKSLHAVFTHKAEFAVGQCPPGAIGAEPVVYVLLSGCVILLGRKGAASAVSWPGDLVMAPVGADGSSMVLKAVAESVCVRATLASLLAQAAKDPEATYWIWQQFERREGELHRRVELLSGESVDRRVLLTIADLAERSRSASPGSHIPLAQNEIADLAGATRETTSTLLNRMRRRGMVELGRRHIQVAAPDSLRLLDKLVEAET